MSAMFGLIAAGVSLMPVAGTDADPLVQLLSRTVNFLAFVSMLIRACPPVWPLLFLH